MISRMKFAQASSNAPRGVSCSKLPIFTSGSNSCVDDAILRNAMDVDAAVEVVFAILAIQLIHVVLDTPLQGSDAVAGGLVVAIGDLHRLQCGPQQVEAGARPPVCSSMLASRASATSSRLLAIFSDVSWEACMFHELQEVRVRRLWLRLLRRIPLLGNLRRRHVVTYSALGEPFRGLWAGLLHILLVLVRNCHADTWFHVGITASVLAEGSKRRARTHTTTQLEIWKWVG